MTHVVPAVLLALLLSAPAASAAPEDVATDVSENVMSPFCPGVTLHDCPSATADRLRARIGRWADRGLTRTEIMQRLEDEFGPDIHALPPGSGIGLVAWILPALALGAGAGIGWILVRRWTKKESPEELPGDEISDEDRRRIEAELAAYRGESPPGRGAQRPKPA